MLEKTLSVQITVRIIYLNSTIETIFLEITGKIDILVLIGFIIELVHMRMDVASESPVYGALGIDTDIETRTVDMHIKTLRQKIGSCGEYIKTVRGVGYRIAAEQA